MGALPTGGRSRIRCSVAGDAGRRALGEGTIDASASLGSAFARDQRLEGMVVTGSSGKGTIRLARERADRFTRAKRAVFLDQLRATCNVTAAAAAAGITRSGAYQKYHADRVFRGEWDSALAEGRVHLEMALIGAARAMLEGEVPTPAPREERGVAPPGSPGGEMQGPPAISGMDAGVAVKLLQLHGSRRPKGSWVRPADPEATRREILAKVTAVKAARAWSGEEASRTSP